MSFVHLHLHTSFSPMRGVDKVGTLLARAGELGMDALAITDTDGLYGAVPFYQVAKRAGVRPIFGVELTDLQQSILRLLGVPPRAYAPPL